MFTQRSGRKNKRADFFASFFLLQVMYMRCMCACVYVCQTGRLVLFRVCLCVCACVCV